MLRRRLVVLFVAAAVLVALGEASRAAMPDPDDDGRGPDRGTGVADTSDRDVGCGNDPDRADDNEGHCHRPAAGSSEDPAEAPGAQEAPVSVATPDPPPPPSPPASGPPDSRPPPSVPDPPADAPDLPEAASPVAAAALALTGLGPPTSLPSDSPPASEWRSPALDGVAALAARSPYAPSHRPPAPGAPGPSEATTPSDGTSAGEFLVPAEFELTRAVALVAIGTGLLLGAALISVSAGAVLRRSQAALRR